MAKALTFTVFTSQGEVIVDALVKSDQEMVGQKPVTWFDCISFTSICDDSGLDVEEYMTKSDWTSIFKELDNSYERAYLPPARNELPDYRIDGY